MGPASCPTLNRSTGEVLAAVFNVGFNMTCLLHFGSFHLVDDGGEANVSIYQVDNFHLACLMFDYLIVKVRLRIVRPDS